MASQTSPTNDTDNSINASEMPSSIFTSGRAMEIDQIPPKPNTLPESDLQEIDGKLTAPETNDSPVERRASPDVESNDVELPGFKPHSADQKGHYMEVFKSEIPDSEAISQASSPEFWKREDIEMSDGELTIPVHIMDQGAISEVSKDSKEFIDVNIAEESITTLCVVDQITLQTEEAKSIQSSTLEIIATSVEVSNVNTRGEANVTLPSPIDETPSVLLSSPNPHYVRATAVRDSDDDDDDDDVGMDEALPPPSIAVETRHIQQSASVTVDDPLTELSAVTTDEDGLLTVPFPLVEAHFPIIMQEPSSATADLEVTEASSTQNHTPETIKEESSTGVEPDYVITAIIQPPGACLLPIETPEIQTSGEQFPDISDDAPEGEFAQSIPILSSIQYAENETTATKPSSSVSKTKQIIATPSTPTKTPNTPFAAPEGSYSKDILITELKAMKIAAIQARNASLEAEIERKRAKLKEVTKELENPAGETVQSHIKLLHDYNDIRDVGQGLVGMIADNRGVRIGELYQEFGVGLKD